MFEHIFLMAIGLINCFLIIWAISRIHRLEIMIDFLLKPVVDEQLDKLINNLKEALK